MKLIIIIVVLVAISGVGFDWLNIEDLNYTDFKSLFQSIMNSEIALKVKEIIMQLLNVTQEAVEDMTN